MYRSRSYFFLFVVLVLGKKEKKKGILVYLVLWDLNSFLSFPGTYL